MTWIIIIVTGLLHALAFPKFNLSPVIFVFLVPLLYLLKTERIKKVFASFFLFAFSSNLLVLYWIPEVMVKYGGTTTFLGILALIALSAFLSLFTAWAGMLIKRAMGVKGTGSMLLIPAIWISKDLVLEYIFNGFPWCFAGYSQFDNLYFIQIAEWGGIHLVSFIIVFINMLIYYFLIYRHKGFLYALVLVFMSVYSIGYILLQQHQAQIASIQLHRAGMIQPNAKNELYSERYSNPYRRSKQEILNGLFRQSQELVQQGAEFVVWPEYTVSIYPLQQPRYLAPFTDFSQNQAPLLAGFTDAQNRNEIYNSAIFFKGEGIEKYDKVHLVPFGEYVLFKDILFFIRKITDQIGEFTPGAEIKNLDFKGHAISTPICYEIIFPTLVRHFIAKGGELLVTQSNDSWYGTTSAPYQLLAMSLFRSIENRRFNLRATSSGISAVISSTGEICEKAGLNREAAILAKFKYIKSKTIFTRFGFLFPFFNLLAILIWRFLPWIVKKTKGPSVK